MDELISVIIPAYNVEKYIDKCLESLCEQTYKNLEFIIIDDCSTDRTPEIVKAWAQRDDRIIMIQNPENVGHALVRNAGIERAGGKYIGFVDSDDYVHPAFYSKLKYLIEQYNADISLCHEIAFRDGEDEPFFDLKPVEDIKVENHEQYIEHFMDDFTGPIGWSCNKLFRAEYLKQIRYRDYMYEDIVMNSEYSHYVTRAVWTEDRMYAYRISETSTTAAGKKMLELPAAKSFLETEIFLAEDSEEFRQRYRCYILGKVANLYANCRKKFGRKAARPVYDLFASEYKKNTAGDKSLKDTIKLWLALRAPFVYSCIARGNK